MITAFNCEYDLMYRGRNKKLPNSSEFSLSAIKSEDVNSMASEGDNCKKTVGPLYVSQSEPPNETSRLIKDESGYNCIFTYCLSKNQVKLLSDNILYVSDKCIHLFSGVAICFRGCAVEEKNFNLGLFGSGKNVYRNFHPML